MANNGTSQFLHSFQVSDKTAANRKDWRDDNVVSDVQDEGNCGCSWAFAAAGSLEAAWKLKGHPFVQLSVQQFVDCPYEEGNSFCAKCKLLSGAFS